MAQMTALRRRMIDDMTVRNLSPATELQRDMTRLGLVVSQIRGIEDARQKRLEQQQETGPNAIVPRLARIVGVGVETADMLVHEVTL